MRVFTVAGHKGGSGKSSLAQAFAVAAAQDGPVALLDADPQATSHAWATRRARAGVQAPVAIKVDAQRLPVCLKELRQEGYGTVFVDTPPSVAPIVGTALLHADAVIIPTRPNPADLESVLSTVKMATSMKKPACVVITQAAPGGTRVHGNRLAREVLERLGVPTCPSVTTHSISWPYAYGSDQTPQEREPKGKAAQEIAAAWTWCQRVFMIDSDHQNMTA